MPLRRGRPGTNENNRVRSARSASEFIRISSRLSHWEHVLVHLVGTGGHEQVQPELASLCRYLDGSPSRACSPDRSAAQMLCASSITTRHGAARCRRFHRVDSTASATSRCSSIVPSEPRSTTVQRLLGLRSSSSSEAGRRPTPPVNPQVGRAHAELACGRRLRLHQLVWAGDHRPALLGCSEEVSQARTPHGPGWSEAEVPGPDGEVSSGKRSRSSRWWASGPVPHTATWPRDSLCSARA